MVTLRVENETHWSADSEFLEDRRRHAWSRNPIGVIVVALLPRSAINNRHQHPGSGAAGTAGMEHSKETPTWQQVAEHFLLTLCDSILVTEAFDNV